MERLLFYQCTHEILKNYDSPGPAFLSAIRDGVVDVVKVEAGRDQLVEDALAGLEERHQMSNIAMHM